jgi:hypothetical protein
VPSQELFCATCDAVTLFDQPPVNGHIVNDQDGDDCPEFACTLCGEAIVFAPLTVVAINLHSRGQHVAPQQRRAA